jgi:hypothetical protein
LTVGRAIAAGFERKQAHRGLALALPPVIV